MARQLLFYIALAIAGLSTTSGVNVWGDQQLTRICEGCPVLGYAVALGHCLNNDNDRCRRAVAKCTSSTTNTACTLLGAFYLGTDIPVLAATGAIGALTGHVTEVAIKQTIKDDALRKQCSSLTIPECSRAAVLGAVDLVTYDLGSKAVRETISLSSKRIGDVVELFGGLATSKTAVTPAQFTMNLLERLPSIRALLTKRQANQVQAFADSCPASESDVELVHNLATLRASDADDVLVSEHVPGKANVIETSRGLTGGDANSTLLVSNDNLAHQYRAVPAVPNRTFDVRHELALLLAVIMGQLTANWKLGKGSVELLFAGMLSWATVVMSQARSRRVFSSSAAYQPVMTST
ncbi:Uncharacterized protein PBTT_07463 [Plasmodiophora brassicae]